MATDILFIHPGNQGRNYQDLAREFTAIATPAWTLLLAEHARRCGLQVALYDANVEGWDAALATELLTRYAPRLVVLMVYGHNPSSSTQTMPAARRIAADLKAAEAGVAIAMGGTHPSAVPERTLAEEPVDYVIQGEGAYTISGLAASLRDGGSLQGIPGLWYREGAGFRLSAAPQLIADLDRELPGYAWDLLPGFDRYRAHTMHCFQEFRHSGCEDFVDVRTPYVALNTSLGCPFSCDYCCIHAVFGRPGVRYWSLDSVISWLDELVRHGVRNIRFDDELFLLDPRRVEAFCDRVIERGYDLNLWVYGRVDTVPGRLLAKMRQAGIRWVCLGIEAGNEAVRRGVNKEIRPDIRAAVAAIRAHGIYVLGNYMFGLPDDTAQTMQETFDLAMDLNTEFANFYSVMAYPGSKLYSEVQGREGVLPPAWDGYSQHGYAARPLPTRHLSAAEVLAFRDRAFELYHSSPRYLEMAGQTFGPRVVEHLRRMLAVKIRRQLLEETD